MKHLYHPGKSTAYWSPCSTACLLLLCSILWLPGRAQTPINSQYQTSRYDYSPVRPSPKVAKLGEYGDIPVNEYTGLPDIKIPLYTYQKNGLELPIYLSYHSTGLRVDERSSEVGLGWSLHAGGVIGHTMYGYDDKGFGGYASKVPLPSMYEATLDANQLKNLCKEVAQFQTRDSEPDVFNYSYGNQSGRYVLDYMGVPHPTPFRDIRINGETITDEQGIRYVYHGYYEQTETFPGSYCALPPPAFGPASRRKFTSASYLSEIISPTKDTIRLSYIRDTVRYYNQSDFTITRLRMAPDCKPVYNNNNNPNFQPCVETTEHYGYKINTITSSNGVVVRFFYAKRLDVSSSRRLTAIEVKDGTTTKRFDFYQSYFVAPSPLTTNDPLELEKRYRLRLDSLREQGQPSHTFTYHRAPGVDFPIIGSYAQDVMGYFNGKPNTALVSADMLDKKPVLIEPTPVYGVNRQIDTVAVKHGMLERITYPTGGTTNLVYEANSYFVGKNFTVDKDSLLVHLEANVRNEIYSGNFAERYQLLTVHKTTRVRLDWSINVENPDDLPRTNSYVDIRLESTNESLYPMPPGSRNSKVLTLQAGTTYRVIASASAETTAGSLTVKVDVTALLGEDKYVQNYPFHGCRIKSITSSGRTAFGQDIQTLYGYNKYKPGTEIIGRDSIASQSLVVSAGGSETGEYSKRLERTLQVSVPTQYNISCLLQSGPSLTATFSVSIVDTKRSFNNTLFSTTETGDSQPFILQPGVYRLTASVQDRESPVLLQIELTARTIIGSYTPEVFTLTNESSGYILYQPQLQYDKLIREAISLADPDPNGSVDPSAPSVRYVFCAYDVLAQSPINPVGSIHGGNIAYSHVQVFQKAATTDLRTDYVYSSAPDRDVHIETPFPPPTSFDWQRGQLLKKISFVKEKQAYTPVQIIRSTYSSFFEPHLLRDSVFLSTYHHLTLIPAYRILMVGAENPPITGIFHYFPYQYISAFSYLQRESTTMVGATGDSLTTTKIFTYGSPNHTQPTIVKTVTSGRDTVVNYLSYPADYALQAVTPTADSRLRALRRLQEYHIQTPVIENRTAVIPAGGTAAQTVRSSLLQYQLVNQVPLVSRVLEWKTDRPRLLSPLVATSTTWQQDPGYHVKEEVVYTPEYSVASLRKTGGLPTSFVRDQDQEVIASVQNATLAQSAFTSFETGATGSWDYDERPTGGARIATARTGKYGYHLSVGAQPIARTGLPSGDYMLVFWATAPPRVVVNGTQRPAAELQLVAQGPGSWRQYSQRLSAATAVQLQANGPALTLDELRLYPVGAQMSSYTFTSLLGITSATTPDGRLMTYEYDAQGRLRRVRDEQGRILTQQQYQYARP
ncbi:RHS repeat protein [Hymenobacter sp. BT635]|uniref:RHS repeat protein n=1 Tax=Hymenobacter nitidus TaxID=2880929 RepID=A0ABS8AKH7_9BACT|nr:RHS repeat domain-containing protein [Hymenobacter nitidus]MCB2380467.1 RHS repeat protein [Hymenobacter nitidus]